MNEQKNIPNLFWPVLLIGVGSLLFLTNIGVIEPIDYSILWRLWPVFLVVVGVNMLFGRRTRWLAALLSAGLAGAVVAFLYFSPVIMDYLPEPEMVTEQFQVDLEDEAQAEINLDFDRGNLTIGQVEDAALLFEASVTHNEQVSFQNKPGDNHEVDLELDDVGVPQIGDFLNEQNQVRAEIGLSTQIPLELKLDIGAGNANMALEDILLSRLEVDTGSGGFEVVLPEGDYSVKLSSGSGDIDVKTAAGSVLDMKADVGSGRVTLTLAPSSEGNVVLDSGSGDIVVIIPEGLAVQFQGSTGSGSIRLPQGVVRISGSDGLSGDKGVWQTEGFEDAKQQLFIEFEIGSGSLRVEYP